MAETKKRLDERTIGRIPVAQYFASSSAGNDSYAITLAPAPTSYETGREYEFKADVANVGSASLNVNGLGAKTIKKLGNLDLNDNDILAGQVVRCQYDGTNMQMVSQVSGGIPVSQVYASSATGTDTYAITLSPAPTAYEIGRTYMFKADVANTGAASLNVNGLGSKTIKKNSSSDLSDNDILAGSIISCVYDGTNMQIIGGIAISKTYPSSFTIPSTVNIIFSNSDEYKIGLTSAPNNSITLYRQDKVAIKGSNNQTISTSSFIGGTNPYIASAIIYNDYIYISIIEATSNTTFYRCSTSSDISIFANWQALTLSGSSASAGIPISFIGHDGTYFAAWNPTYNRIDKYSIASTVFTYVSGISGSYSTSICVNTIGMFNKSSYYSTGGVVDSNRKIATAAAIFATPEAFYVRSSTDATVYYKIII